MVAKLRRAQRTAQRDLRPARSQDFRPVVADRGFDREASLAPVGEELLDAARIHHRTRQRVVADLFGLVDHEDRALVVPALVEVTLELNRTGESSGACADDQDVDGQVFPFDVRAVERGDARRHGRIPAKLAPGGRRLERAGFRPKRISASESRDQGEPASSGLFLGDSFRTPGLADDLAGGCEPGDQDRSPIQWCPSP